MNNRGIAHAWANQTKASGKGSNFYFDGPSIYSYGQHFEIARIIERPTADRRGVVLFTTRTYSISTTRHISYARAAIDNVHYRVFDVPRVDVNGNTGGFKIGRAERSARHAENVAALVGAYETAREAVLRGRTDIDYKMELVIEARDMAAAYDSVFSKALRKADREKIRAVNVGPAWTNGELNKINAKREAARVADEAAAARREAALQLEMEEARGMLALWRAGVKNVSMWGFNSLPVALRVSHDGKEIETSHGAAVPVEEARALYARLRAGHVQFNPGAEIAGFPIHGETGGILKIGCHNIPMAEVEAIAAALNW